jgi:hypothetical protein
MLPPDLCYILLFHLAYCVLLCPHRFISLGVPANFLLVFKQQQGHELCSSCTIWPTNACKSTTLGMCVLNFSERTASCYSNILCPHALSSNLRLETFKTRHFSCRDQGAPWLFQHWLPIYPHASGWYQLVTVMLLCFI